MGLIIKLLKLKITKMFLCLLMIAFIASLYFCKDWYFLQFQRCKGFYYIYLGDKAFKEQKYQKAVDNYRIGLKYYPEHASASCNLGNIYVSFENYYEAVNAYETALKHNPNYMVCRMDLGIILAEKMADYDKAIQEYGKVINSRPFTVNIPFVFNNKETTQANKGIAYYNMGLAYRGKAVFVGDNTNTSLKYLKQAKESYEKAQEYLKDNYDNTFNLALTNHLLGDYTSAADGYCDAINIKPDSYEAHYNFALLLRTMDENKLALEEFEKTLMLLDYQGNQHKNKYILGIIGEVKRRIIKENGYDYLKDRVAPTSLNDGEIVYSKGKVISSKQKEYKLNDLLKCTYKNEKK